MFYPTIFAFITLSSVVTNLELTAPGETNRGSVGSEGQRDKWACSECTFSNHPDLESCEICEMPRFELGQC